MILEPEPDDHEQCENDEQQIEFGRKCFWVLASISLGCCLSLVAVGIGTKSRGMEGAVISFFIFLIGVSIAVSPLVIIAVKRLFYS